MRSGVVWRHELLLLLLLRRRLSRRRSVPDRSRTRPFWQSTCSRGATCESSGCTRRAFRRCTFWRRARLPGKAAVGSTRLRGRCRSRARASCPAWYCPPGGPTCTGQRAGLAPGDADASTPRRFPADAAGSGPSLAAQSFRRKTSRAAVQACKPSSLRRRRRRNEPACSFFATTRPNRRTSLIFRFFLLAPSSRSLHLLAPLAAVNHRLWNCAWAAGGACTLIDGICERSCGGGGG